MINIIFFWIIKYVIHYGIIIIIFGIEKTIRFIFKCSTNENIWIKKTTYNEFRRHIIMEKCVHCHVITAAIHAKKISTIHEFISIRKIDTINRTINKKKSMADGSDVISWYSREERKILSHIDEIFATYIRWSREKRECNS